MNMIYCNKNIIIYKYNIKDQRIIMVKQYKHQVNYHLFKKNNLVFLKEIKNHNNQLFLFKIRKKFNNWKKDCLIKKIK